MDLGEFSLRIRAKANDIVTRTDDMVRRVALAVDQTVVLATPVDTGRARSNWIVRLGEASNETREAESAASVLAQGAATISQYKGGTSIHITNNLPYINRLNEGWSAQAKPAFVESAVQIAFEEIRKSKLVG